MTSPADTTPAAEPVTLDQRLAAMTGTVLLAFGADWATPWRLLADALTRLEAEGHQVMRVNVDEHSKFADTWAIQSLPTFVVVNDGQETRRWLGAVAPSELAAGLISKRSTGSAGRGGMRRRR